MKAHYFLLALAACVASGVPWRDAHAQTAEPPPTEDDANTTFDFLQSQEPSDEDAPVSIVVTGQRFVIEQTYDFDRVLGLGATTIGEALDELALENGDADPTYLVNGEPITDRGDIEDFPVEAIERIEALPRGSATRAGGRSGERVYNIVLRRSSLTRTLSASRRSSFYWDWDQDQLEAQAAYVRGRNRVNLTLRALGSNSLLESDRDIEQPENSSIYSPLGNVAPASSLAPEIDPFLSALAGEPVIIAAVPFGIPSPVLADFVAGANDPSLLDASFYRTLRPEAESYEAALTGNQEFTPWLSATYQARLMSREDASLNGVPRASFLLPSSASASPFSEDVLIRVGDAERPLEGRSKYETASILTTLSATFSTWRFPLTLRFDERSSVWEFQRVDTFSNLPIDPSVNPFDGSLAAAIPIVWERTENRTTVQSASIGAEGPVLELPAGALFFRSTLGVANTRVRPTSTLSSSAVAFSRDETAGQVSLTIPLLSESATPAWGSAEVTGDWGHTDLGRFGDANRQEFNFNWAPRNWLRFNAVVSDTQTPVAPDTLFAPFSANQNARVFDPIQNETVDVVSITGGNPDLLPESQRQTRFSLALAPYPRINLQLTADYTETERRNIVAGLFDANAAVAEAFPERFERDASGTLIGVDYRPVNFDLLHTRDLRGGMSFVIPLYDATPPTSEAEARALAQRSPARPNIQFTLSYTRVLESSIRPRAGTPAFDLLEGGAFGLGGAIAPERATMSLALTDRGNGGRLSVVWQDASALDVGTVATPDRLHFEPLAKIDLALFADLGSVFSDAPWLRRTRVGLTFENLTDETQSVTNQAGETPLRYQTGYRDPIGRSVRLELRRSF